jgi:hypothetical protein
VRERCHLLTSLAGASPKLEVPASSTVAIVNGCIPLRRRALCRERFLGGPNAQTPNLLKPGVSTRVAISVLALRGHETRAQRRQSDDTARHGCKPALGAGLPTPRIARPSGLLTAGEAGRAHGTWQGQTACERPPVGLMCGVMRSAHSGNDQSRPTTPGGTDVIAYFPSRVLWQSRQIHKLVFSPRASEAHRRRPAPGSARPRAPAVRWPGRVNCAGKPCRRANCGGILTSGFWLRQTIADQPAREGYHTLSQTFLSYSPQDGCTASAIYGELRRDTAWTCGGTGTSLGGTAGCAKLAAP